MQVLTSRPLLTEVVQDLQRDGEMPNLGPDPIDAVQRMLTVAPVAGTQVVVLSAQGRLKDFLPRLVNTVTDVYRQRVAASYKDASATTSSALAEEEQALARDAAAKRQSVDAFRARYDIVSMERNENQALGKLSGLETAYNKANADFVAAQGHEEAVRRAAAAGQGAGSAKDDPTLADLEKRASVLREQLQEMQRKFTPDYLAMDPDAISLHARLDDLTQQLTQRRAASREASLGAAQEQLSSAKSALAQLKRDLDQDQHDAQEFATHLNEYKALQEDLDHVEALHRDALDRLTKLQASSRERAPQVALLEAAVPSDRPWRPDYQTDAIASVAGSLVFGFIAVLFGEFIAGPAPAPSRDMMVRHSWEPAPLGRENPVPASLPFAPPLVELAAPVPALRELAEGEVADLVVAASGDARLACVGLLMGLGADELVALRWSDIDLAGGVIHVRGASPRDFALEEPLRGLLDAGGRAGTAPVLCDAQGAPLGVDDVARMVLYAAYDAVIERPQEVTPAVLRYTYTAFLLRQGIRMGDIGRIVGHIPQADLLVYMQLAAADARRPFEDIARVLPPLQRLAGNAGA